MRYVCSVCGYIYDEAREEAKFSDLPDSWKCPLCRAAKSLFAPEKGAEEPTPFKAPSASAQDAAQAQPVPTSQAEGLAHTGEELLPLSAGQLAALCSNLARGCEKQYHEEEAQLFRKLADYFTSITPAVPDASVEALAALFQDDLSAGYPALKAAAQAGQDRGTQRICVWGEKVTNMLRSLLEQYQAEGEALLAGTPIWVCTVCGFVYIGEAPPQLCPVCKVPAWKFEQIEGRASA